jgi:hypothetical protein
MINFNNTDHHTLLVLIQQIFYWIDFLELIVMHNDQSIVTVMQGNMVRCLDIFNHHLVSQSLALSAKKQKIGKFPGIKHHFLWHLTEVWRRQVPSTVHDILLLEDDQLPTYDFYVAMKALLRVRLNLCEDCGGVLIGHHSRSGAHNISQVRVIFKSLCMYTQHQRPLTCDR